MPMNLDTSVSELSRARLRLRSNLSFTPQHHGGTTYCHLEDADRAKHYRLGLAEYAFISLLDGSRTFADALSQTAGSLGAAALGEAEAMSVCSWLLAEGLAQTVEDPFGGQRTIRPAARGRWLSQCNPFWLKLPLIRPGHSLNRLLRLVGWLYGWPAAVAWVALCLIALAAVANQWERFQASAVGVLAPANWLWIAATWGVLKILHEMSHALVCRRYGGEVREMGVVFVLLAPLAYVDVTSAWRFRSKWQRMHTAAAGMYIEWLVAALAALVWSQTRSTLAAHLLHNAVVMASISTLFFNANPLMRFDGYYLLSDLLAIPNLHSLGRQYVAGLARRWFLGLHDSLRLDGGWRGVTIRVYGVLALLWRIVVSSALILVTATLLPGTGILLSALGLGLWLGPASYRTYKDLVVQAAGGEPIVRRFAIRGGLCGACLCGLLACANWPAPVRCWGTVEYADLVSVRPAAAGFVQRLEVADGDFVEKGQLLALLSNEELEHECRDLSLAVEQSRAKERIYLDEAKIAAAQIESANRQALEKRLAEKTEQAGHLWVRSPTSGRVVARTLSQKARTYLKEGEELLVIGNENEKEVLVAIPHDCAQGLSRLVGDQVLILLPLRPGFSGRLRQVAPRATTTPIHPGLCAANGGPLAATRKDDPDPGSAAVELAEPHFQGFVQLPAEAQPGLRAGESGVVGLGYGSRSVAELAYATLTRWIRTVRAAAD
jgi:putative peptide zinc metalloprotease protein